LAGRYDKYDPVSGGFRAAMAADKSTTDIATPIGVGLDSNGRVVAGAGQTGVIGVLMITKNVKAGDVVDVMTSGEIVEMASLAAGTKYTANTTTGAITNGAGSATQVLVGWTVEATRLIVRVAQTWQVS
jgi:hypothetical protein